MKRKLSSLREFFFSNWEILSTLASTNLKRMVYFCPILVIIHGSHAFTFWKSRDTSQGVELLWKESLMYTHLVGLFLSVLFGSVGLFLIYKKKTNGLVSLLTLYISFFSYILFASFVTAIDQLVTTSITPFIVLCTGLASIYITAPGIMLPIYTIGYLLFVKIVTYTQKDPEVLLSVQINGLSAIGLGIAVSIILYLNHKARIRQESIILSQKKDLERKNSELVALNKAKSDFLSIAAHDLKNPLGVIQGMSSLLLESESISTSSHEKVYSIMESAKRMLHLITELLNINQLESQKVNVKWEICDLNSITEESIKTLMTLVNRKNQTIITKLSEESLPIKVDRVYLSDVIENLISNAIKYSDYNKSIYIKTYHDNKSIYFEIQDEGPGIKASEQKKLFEKFSKLGTQPTGGESSTGLGLFIVKKLTDAMNGNIKCSSTEGVGTLFFLSFPKVEDLKYDTKYTYPNEELTNIIKLHTIMVVDDDPSNRNLLKLFLSKLGNKPLLVSSGKEALEKIKSQKIDIVFMDMDMPEMDGFETRNSIKNLGYSPIFVLCTGTSFESDLSKNLGFDFYLEKPFDKDKLKRTLEKIFFP